MNTTTSAAWPRRCASSARTRTDGYVDEATLEADIVASKEWANRDKDQLALPELYRLQGRGDHRPEPTRQPDERGPRPG